MSYIIKHDFDQPIPYYARLVDSEKFEELYSPKFATQFETREKAQEFIDTYSSVAEYSKIVDVATAIEEYDKWVESGTVRGTRKCINTTVSRPYNGESLDEVIDWWIYQKHNDREIKYEHYKTWPELYSISKHLFGVNVYHNSNDYSETYITFQIRTSKDGEFSVFESELSKVMNSVTYKDDEGYLIFPIFDHYLSEHGNSCSLLIHPKTKKVKIGRGRYSNSDEFATLEEAFNYMKRDRYYE